MEQKLDRSFFASPALMQLTENMVAISFNTSLQKYGGDMAVASMSILNSVMQFVMLLLPGLVQGAQPLLSYNLGAKNLSRVKKTFRLLLLCGISGSFLIWLACMSALETVASVFTDDPVLIRYTGRTMRIYLAMLFIYGICVLASISSGLVHEIPKESSDQWCRSGVQRNVAGNRTRISISDPCDGSNAGPYPPVTGL